VCEQYRSLRTQIIREQNAGLVPGRRAGNAKATVHANLHRVAQYLTERYKFKYLSTIDLMQFEESTNSMEASEIKKAIEDKQ
jgi:hypothetical protein